VFAYTLNPSTQTTPTGQLAVGTGINLLGQPSAVLIR
jgi:hypothetical protein